MENLDPSRRKFLVMVTAGGGVATLPRPVSGASDLRSIAYGETKSGEIDSDDPTGHRGHYEPVSFDGETGDVVTIRMQSSDDPYLKLRAPSGEIVAEDDDGYGSGYDSEIAGFPLDETGEYIIIATSFDENATFAYTLSLEAESQSDTIGDRRQGSGTLSNDHLAAFVDNGGNFKLTTADGAPLTYPNGLTSGLTVQVDGTNYVVGQPSGRSMGPYRDGNTSFAGDGTAATTRWELPNSVTVTQRISLMGQATSFDLTVENTGEAAREIKVRYLFDYQVGPQDGAPIVVNGQILTTETRFESPAFDSWLTYDRLPDPTLTGVGTLGRSADRIEFVAWEDASESGYTYNQFDPDKEFYRDGYTTSPESDSAGLLYFNLGSLEPGSESSVTTYYGVGDPEQSNLGELDDVLVDYRDAVTGYVDTVIRGKANGYASQFLREEADRGYPNITGSDDRSEAFRNTVVKFFEYRAGAADRDEIDLGYFDDIRTLTNTIPEELSEADSEELYRFSDEMFGAIPSGQPDDIRQEAEVAFRDHLLGVADQEYRLTVGRQSLQELKDGFVSEFDELRQSFIRECRDSDISPDEVDTLVTQVAQRTQQINQTATRKLESYDEIVQRALAGEQVLSTAEAISISSGVGGVVGGTIGLGAGLLLAGPTGEEAALIGIGTSVGSVIGSTAGGLLAPILTDGDIGGNRWESSFVGTDTWKAIASFEVQWLYHLKRAPNRVLPADLLNYAGSELDAHYVTVTEELFELGCEQAVTRLDFDITVENVSTADITAEDQIGDSVYARQEGTITVRNPEANEATIVPAFLRDECSVVAHTTARESSRGYVTLPPRSELPEIDLGDTAEIPFSYVTPARSNADFGVEFRLKATPVSSTVRGAYDVISHTVGVSDNIDTSVVATGKLREGESVGATVDTGLASKSVINLSYPGSNLDVHLYSGSDHVGRNYQTGEYENQISSASGTGPDGGDGFEAIRVGDATGSYRTEVVAVATSTQGSTFSLTNARSSTLPPSVSVLPTRINVSGMPGGTVAEQLTVRETAGDVALDNITFEPTSLTVADRNSEIAAANVELNPEDVTVNAGGEADIELSIAVPDDAVNGAYFGSVEINANAGDVATEVPVELHVIEDTGSTTQMETASSGNALSSRKQVPSWAPSVAAGGGTALSIAVLLRYFFNRSDPSSDDAE